MDRICTQCARKVLHSRGTASSTIQPAVLRSFTTSSYRGEGGPLKITRVQVDSSARENRRPTDATAASSVPINQTPRSGQLLRRTGASQDSSAARPNAPPRGMILRRTGQAAPPPGQLLRRSTPQGPGGRTDANQGRKRAARSKRTVENAREQEEGEEDATEEELDAYVEKYIDRPVNPTEEITYNPSPQDILELQKDWPNTPLSTTGLSASVTQKIEFLARRLAHGYQTPTQIAEHFYKGNLTRFESEDERKEVLKIAAELAQKRASQLSERKGSEVTAENMEYVALDSRAEKKMLLGDVVQGNYGELERQRMPFLDSVVRNLRNNSTYQKGDADKFMAAVEKLMPAQAQRRPQQPPQAQKSA